MALYPRLFTPLSCIKHRLHSSHRLRNGIVCTEHAGLNAPIGCAQGFRSVLKDHCTVPVADLPDFVDLAGCALEIRHHDYLNLKIQIIGFFQRHRVHIPVVVLSVYLHRNTSLIDNWIHREIESRIARRYKSLGERTCSRSRLALPPAP